MTPATLFVVLVCLCVVLLFLCHAPRWVQLKQKEEAKYVVGAICEARFEKDKWYTCKIEDVILPKDVGGGRTPVALFFPEEQFFRNHRTVSLWNICTFVFSFVSLEEISYPRFLFFGC